MSTDLGNTWKETVPSGKIWEIRETTGEDDAILSKISDAMDGANINNFLANIIVGPEKPLAEDILTWPINDKYVLLFKWRVRNLGYEFQFKDSDPNDKKKRVVDYTEDLTELDGDLADKDYKPKPNQLYKYPNGTSTHIEFKISTGKQFRFKIMTGIEEKAADDLPKDSTNKNTPLLVRQLEIFKGQKWEKVLNFHHVTSLEMKELRGSVDKYDRQWDPIITVTNPYTNLIRSFPLFALPTFFFPEETT